MHESLGNLRECYTINGALSKKSAMFPESMQLGSFKYHVSQYSRRNLTYESDSLQALAGVISKFSSESFGTSSIRTTWGIPIHYNRVVGPSSSQPVDHSYGFCWTNGYLQPDLHNFSVLKRKKGFPSWSWVGWSGPVTWMRQDLNKPDPHFEILYPQSTELESMQSLHLHQLTVSAKCVILRFICLRAISPGNSSPKEKSAPKGKDEYQNGFLFLDISPSEETQHVSALHMSYTPQSPDDIQSFAQDMTSREWTGVALRDDGHWATTLLVIGKRNPSDECFERYGIIMVRSSWFDAQEKVTKVFKLA